MFRLAFGLIVVIALDYPIAALIQHGLEPSLWPGEVLSVGQWFEFLFHLHLNPIASAYWEMAIGRSPAFAHGGLWPFWVAATLLMTSLLFVLFGKPKQPLRDEMGVYGDARFATSSTLAKLDDGLELGIDPETGRAVRVRVEGTLVTLAPPRKGKTWGLLIPALSFPEPNAWAGPAVVIDTKGEVYRAVADRRRALGRRVVCLDPLDLVKGTDTWNPLARIDADDILYLQRTALALLPEVSEASSEASAYFRNRAVDLIVGAMVVVIRTGNATPAAVRDLLDDDTRFSEGLRALGNHPVARTALSIMEADPKTRDPVRSTAAQAFQWLADHKLSALTASMSFDFADLSADTIDLFIAVPPQYRQVLAPALRWLLSDLFAAIRLHRPKQRVLVLVDEAAAVGRFSELLTAANELPGYGASLWTFWQDRSQLTSLYGEAGAATLINTAEVVTVFNISAADPDETDRWSRVVGEFTALVWDCPDLVDG